VEHRHGLREEVEMKFLRGIVGKTRRGRIRKTYIRGELKVEEIQDQIEENRFR
jgi:hypothetical protein